MAEEKRPLLLKIDSTKNRYPPPEPFPERPPNPTPHQISPPDRHHARHHFYHPVTHQLRGKNFGTFSKKKMNNKKLLKNWCLGNMNPSMKWPPRQTVAKKVTLLKKILYRQMRKLLHDDLKSLLKK